MGCEVVERHLEMAQPTKKTKKHLPKANLLILICQLHLVGVIVRLDCAQSGSVNVLGTSGRGQICIVARDLGNLERIMQSVWALSDCVVL